MNPVTEYYVNQAGSGLSGFTGLRYQRGGGWLSNVWSTVGLPVLKFLGRQALSSGLSVAGDAIEGKNVKESAIGQLKRSGRNTIGYLKDMTEQSGSGRKRRRRRKVTSKRVTSKKLTLKKTIKRRPRKKKVTVKRRRRVKRYSF